MKEPIFEWPWMLFKLQGGYNKARCSVSNSFCLFVFPHYHGSRPKSFPWFTPAQTLPSHSNSVVLPEIKAVLGQDVPVCDTNQGHSLAAGHEPGRT